MRGVNVISLLIVFSVTSHAENSTASQKLSVDSNVTSSQKPAVQTGMVSPAITQASVSSEAVTKTVISNEEKIPNGKEISQVAAVAAMNESWTAAAANQSYTLQCPLENEISWHRDGQKIESAQGKFTVQNNGTLWVQKVGPTNSGDYQCSNGSHFHNVTLWVAPYVDKPDKNQKNVIESDPFVMECKSWGHPSVSVTWMHNGEPIVADDRILLKAGHAINSTLRIQSTRYEDAGNYTCVASNTFGNDAFVMEMKVKDKLAALWPFFGICLEVAILCTIIFIYEKRRNNQLNAEQRREEEAEHLKSENETKASEELRQRKI